MFNTLNKPLEKMDKKDLITIEQGQMMKIDRCGLVRRIVHDRYIGVGKDGKELLRKVTGKRRTFWAIGQTTAMLYAPKTLKRGDRGFIYDGVEPIAVGITFCSACEDNFNKRIGRIRATGRAIRKLEKEPKDTVTATGGFTEVKATKELVEGMLHPNVEPVVCKHNADGYGKHTFWCNKHNTSCLDLIEKEVCDGGDRDPYPEDDTDKDVGDVDIEQERERLKREEKRIHKALREIRCKTKMDDPPTVIHTPQSFKVGEQVLCLARGRTGLRTGKLYTVSELHNDGKHVRVGTTWWHNINKFVKVPPNEGEPKLMVAPEPPVIPESPVTPEPVRNKAFLEGEKLYHTEDLHTVLKDGTKKIYPPAKRCPDCDKIMVKPLSTKNTRKWGRWICNTCNAIFVYHYDDIWTKRGIDTEDNLGLSYSPNTLSYATTGDHARMCPDCGEHLVKPIVYGVRQYGQWRCDRCNVLFIYKRGGTGMDVWIRRKITPKGEKGK